MMNILTARDVAMLPTEHSEDDRRNARHSLLASAAVNKDRRRAAADVQLANALSEIPTGNERLETKA
ncbi:MAG: hypothetical protein AAGL98_12445 [Planctomycetota bacterium]